MKTTNRPQSISAQEFGLRHMQALQRLRDETLLVFNALEKVPQADLDQSFRDLPRLVKDAVPEFAAEYARAKLNLIVNTLRRLLQTNSLFFERLFSDGKQADSSAADAREGGEPPRPRHPGKMIELFRDKLKEAGLNEAPAATLGSLAALERLFAEELAGTASATTQRHDLEIVLVEVDRGGGNPESARLNAKPWRQHLAQGDRPKIDARLLESVFSTSIIAAHEALHAGEKLHAATKTLT